MSRKVKNLTTGPLFQKIILYTLPLIATAVLQLLFNTADIIVVGRWGGETSEACANSLAAVGSCSTLCALLITFFFGLSVGSGVCVAHDIGAGHEDEVQKTVSTSIITSVGCGVFVATCGLIFAKDLLVLMGTDPTVLEEATLYMRAYLCGIPANLLYNFCSSILRSKGDTVRPLMFLTIAGVVNVGLNLGRKAFSVSAHSRILNVIGSALSALYRELIRVSILVRRKNRLEVVVLTVTDSAKLFVGYEFLFHLQILSILVFILI